MLVAQAQLFLIQPTAVLEVPLCFLVLLPLVAVLAEAKVRLVQMAALEEAALGLVLVALATPQAHPRHKEITEARGHRLHIIRQAAVVAPAVLEVIRLGLLLVLVAQELQIALLAHQLLMLWALLVAVMFLMVD